MYVNTFIRIYDKICINKQIKGVKTVQFKRIKDLRDDKEKKQIEIAELLKITQQQYSLYETGKREIPMSMCLILADYYKVSLDYIAGRTNNKKGIGYIEEKNENTKKIKYEEAVKKIYQSIEEIKELIY